MAKRYTVEVLSPKEFTQKRLADGRYAHVDESNLGFADPVRRTAYVRDTAVLELNKYLVNHEMEHLFEGTHGTDEDEHGIRHKKGSDIVRNVAAISLAPITLGGSLGVGPFGGARVGTQGMEEKTQKAIPKEAVDAIPYATGGLGYAIGGPTGAGIGAGIGKAAKQSYEGPDEDRTAGSVLRGVGKEALGGLAIGGATAGLSALGVPRIPAPGNFSGFKTAGVNTPNASLSTAPSSPGVAGTPGSGGGTGALRVPKLNSSALNAEGMLQTQGQAQASNFGAGQLGQAASQMSASPTANFDAISRMAIPALQQIQAMNFADPQFNYSSPAAPPAVPTAQQPAAGQSPAVQGTQNTNNVVNNQQNQNKSSGFFDMSKADLARIGIGSGLALGADAFRGAPEVPDLSNLDSVRALAQTTQNGSASPLGQLASKQLESRLLENFQGPPEAVKGAISRAYDEERQRVISQFKAVRPNADLATDSAYRQVLFDLERREAEAMAGAEYSEFTRFQGQRGQDIAQALGVDTQTLNTLTNLASLDVAQIVEQLKIDAASAQQFKQTFGNIGALIAQGSIGTGGGLGSLTVNIPGLGGNQQQP